MKRKTAPANKTGWPAEKIEWRPLSGLREHPNNARRHSDEQIDLIAASIHAHGWTIPLLVDEGGMLIAGHARLEAAKRIGLTEAPCMVALGWSDQQKRAYALKDNQLALLSEWDDDALKRELDELADLGEDLAALGFDENDDGPSVEVKRVETSEVEDDFWLTVNGPLRLQAEAIRRVSEALSDMREIEIDVGAIQRD